MRMTPWLLRAAALALALLAPSVAHAYMGPSLGLGAIGVVLGVIGSIFLAIFSFLWLPVKRLIRRMRRSAEERKSRD